MSDDMLLRLHDALRRPGGLSSMTVEERRAYNAKASRKYRAKAKAAAHIDLENSPAVVRNPLADAALMLLATSGPGSELIRKVWKRPSVRRSAIPIRTEQRAKSGRLKTKLVCLVYNREKRSRSATDIVQPPRAASSRSWSASCLRGSSMSMRRAGRG